MLFMNEQAMASLQVLREELAWLEREHPDKQQLIGLARSNIRTIEEAGSFRSVGINTDDLFKYALSRVEVPSNPPAITCGLRQEEYEALIFDATKEQCRKKMMEPDIISQIFKAEAVEDDGTLQGDGPVTLPDR